MIPMSCPNCGRRGTIPPDRLNTRMHCKKCDAVFHMDKSGKIVVGDPDAGVRSRAEAKVAQGDPKQQKKVKSRKERDLVELSFRELLNKIPKPVLFLAVGVVLLAFAYYGLKLDRISFFPEGYGKSRDSRMPYAANAFVDEKPDVFVEVAAKGTEDDLRQYYDALRPRLAYKGPQTRGRSMIPQYLQVGDSTATEADFTVRITVPVEGPQPEDLAELIKTKRDKRDNLQPGYNQNSSFDLPLHWVKKGDAWFIDGTATRAFLDKLKAGDKKP